MCDDRTDYHRHARGGSRTARAPERRFTLIEVLIALAIVAVALGAVMRAIALDVRALSDLGCDRRRPPPQRRRRRACRDARGRARKWRDIVITYDVIALAGR